MAIRGLQNNTIQGIPKDNDLTDRADQKIAALQRLTELFAKSEANAREMRVTEPVTNQIPTLAEKVTNEARTGSPRNHSFRTQSSTNPGPFERLSSNDDGRLHPGPLQAANQENESGDLSILWTSQSEHCRKRRAHNELQDPHESGIHGSHQC
jgi:hypothetical protein